MVGEDAPPPRKKSRFFSNGKSKIESLLRRKKNHGRDKDKGPASESDTDDEAPNPATNGDRYASAARTITFKSIGPNPNLGLAKSVGSEGRKATHGQDDSDSSTARPNKNCEAIQSAPTIRHLPFGASSSPSSCSNVYSSSSAASKSSVAVPYASTTHEGRQPVFPNTQPYSSERTLDSGPASNHSVVQSCCSNIPLQYQPLHTPTDFQQNPRGNPDLVPSTLQQSFQDSRTRNSFDPFTSDSITRPRVPNDTTFPELANSQMRSCHQKAQPTRILHNAERPNGLAKPSDVVDVTSNTEKLTISSSKGDQNAVSRLHNNSTSVAQDDQNGFARFMDQHIYSRLRVIHPALIDGPTKEPIMVDQHNPTMRAKMQLESPLENTSLDLDRDVDGNLLAPHLRRFAIQEPCRPPQVRRSAHNSSTTPANLYSSPKRMANAIAVSTHNLKRKRGVPYSPPPAYIYVRNNDPTFNVFTNGILLYPEICFALASHLPLRELVSLYAISRDFHTIVDSRFTTVCLTQTICKAPESARAFPFRTYSQFCREDPAARIPHPDPAKAAKRIARKIPSFRWVAFVLHREKVVHETITIFAERGCPLPARCSLALKRMWILMDIPDNARRIALIHNHRIFTELDLYFMMCFFVKLDMLANDPIADEKRDGLRKILMSQQGGLDIILKVLKRETWSKKSDFLIAWVKNSMNMDNIDQEQLDQMACTSVFGVPVDKVGIGKYEYWGTKGIINERTGHKRGYLLRPDQLVMREAIRRGLRFDKHFMRCVMYGYVRPDTLESYAPRKYGRRIGEWMNEDYDINDSIGGLRALSVKDGGDPLLDLGNTSRGSRYTAEKEPVSRQERMMREGQNKLLQRLYDISEAERYQQV